MGTYDLVFKESDTYGVSQGQTLVNEAKEFLASGQKVEAREKCLQAVDAYKISLNQKPHCRLSRLGLIEVMETLGNFFSDFKEIIIDDIMMLNGEKDDEEAYLGWAHVKAAVSDALLGNDWKNQCDGKYGGSKPHYRSWKDFYLYNEHKLESLTTHQDKVLWAIECGHDRLLTFLFDKSNKENEKLTSSEKTLYLQSAIQSRYIIIVTMLLDRGFNVNGKTKEKHTPLFWAVQVGDEAIAKLLIDHGAKVNIKDRNGVTPLHIAAFYGFHDMVTLLVEKGSRINVYDNETKASPLHMALRQGHQDIVLFLLDKGASIKGKDAFQRHLLHWAVTNDQVQLSALLIKYGANVNAKDDLGRAPLHWAAQYGFLGSMELLVEQGANINAMDKYDEKPLVIAAFSGHTKLVSYLFENGAR